jgi:DNA-binding protein HU-beta
MGTGERACATAPEGLNRGGTAEYHRPLNHGLPPRWAPRPIGWPPAQAEQSKQQDDLEEELVNKKELIESVAEATGQSKKVAGDLVDAFIGTVQTAVTNGDRVSLPGFGTFERRQRSARTARNPRTGEPIQIAAAKVPAFKAGSAFKQSVNK